MSFIESIDKAIEHLGEAAVRTGYATHEIRKYKHPADGELAGLQHQIETKIRRLQELRRFEEMKK
jgi:hypothetical protein